MFSSRISIRNQSTQIMKTIAQSTVALSLAIFSFYSCTDEQAEQIQLMEENHLTLLKTDSVLKVNQNTLNEFFFPEKDKTDSTVVLHPADSTQEKLIQEQELLLADWQEQIQKHREVIISLKENKIPLDSLKQKENVILKNIENIKENEEKIMSQYQRLQEEFAEELKVMSGSK